MTIRNSNKWTRRAILTTGALIAANGTAAANPNKKRGKGKTEKTPRTVGNSNKTRVHDTVSAASMSSGNPYQQRINFTVDIRVQVEFTDEPHDEPGDRNETKIYVKGIINGHGTGEDRGEYKVKSKIDDEAYLPLNVDALAVGIELEFIPIRGTEGDVRTEGAVLTLTPVENPNQARIANAIVE